MPPRIRTIKPELWRDQRLQRQDLGARLTFIGLISHADDDGRLEGDRVMLRSLLHPSDAKVTQRLFNRWIDQLDKAGLIRCYEVEDEPYVDLPKFKTHQRIDKPRESTIPAYMNGSIPRFVDDDSWMDR
jgi:hypothetical protein